MQSQQEGAFYTSARGLEELFIGSLAPVPVLKEGTCLPSKGKVAGWNG